MSQESVIQFFDAVFQNKQLQGQLNYEVAKSAPNALIQIAQENGYSFSTEDLKTVLEAQAELSDKQLEAIAGGRKPQFVDFSDDPHFIQANKPK